MAVFPNLPIFAQNGGHFVCYYGNRGLADKSSIYFLLSKTHSILFAEKIARFAQIKKLSYLPAVCGLKLIIYHVVLPKTKDSDGFIMEF